MSPASATKLVSVAPRSSRLNSSILPRLRSHPIHRFSCAFHCRVRWNRKNRLPLPSACLSFSASIPARAAARISASRGSVSVSASRTSPSRAKCRLRSMISERLDLEVLDQLAGALDAVQDRRNDDHRPRVVRNARELEPRQAARRNQVADDALDDLNRQLARGDDGKDARATISMPAPAPCSWAKRSVASTNAAVPSAIVPR